MLSDRVMISHNLPNRLGNLSEIVSENHRGYGRTPVFKQKKGALEQSSFILRQYAPAYDVTYLPVSSTRLAIFSCNAMMFTGSCLARRRTIAIWVRSMSPSATAATTFFADASSRLNAPSR